MAHSVRFGAAMLPAFVVSALLLFLMQALIARAGEEVIPEAALSIVDFVRVPKIPQLSLSRNKPAPPPAVDEPPPVPKQTVIQEDGPSIWGGPREHTAPTLSPAHDRGFSDGAALVLVTAQPTYPRRALERGLSGWVLLRFDVDAQGLVVAPQVMDHCAWTQGSDECTDSPSTVFDHAALRAVAKSRYKPRVEGGVNVGVFGVMSRIAFQMEE